MKPVLDRMHVLNGDQQQILPGVHIVCVPGSAMISSSGRPFGDQLSTQ